MAAGKLIHYCPYGCCSNRLISVEKNKCCIDDCILSVRPKIPALNRWTRLYQPLCWWTFAYHLFGIIPAAFMKVCKACDSAEAIQVTLADLFAHGGGKAEDRAYRIKEGTRWKKAAFWLSQPHLHARLCLTLTVLLPAMDIMHDIFKVEDTDLCAIAFASPLSSPSPKAIDV